MHVTSYLLDNSPIVMHSYSTLRVNVNTAIGIPICRLFANSIVSHSPDTSQKKENFRVLQISGVPERVNFGVAIPLVRQ